jgi:hypothetical protein
MPNAIKYKTGNLTGSLQKGNVALGVTALGPTETTGLYNGYIGNPTAGRYIVYEVDVSNPPKIYYPANDAELIRLARQEGATGENAASAAAASRWMAAQPNLLVSNYEYPPIVTNGLVMAFDSTYSGSYPAGGGSTIHDLMGSNSYNGTIYGNPSWANNISNLSICLLLTKTSTGTGYANHPINKWNTAYNVNASFILYHFENYQGNNQDGVLGWYGYGTNSGWANIGTYGFTTMTVGQTKWVALQYNSTEGGQAWVNGSKSGGRSGNNGTLGPTTSTTYDFQIYIPDQIGTGYISHILFYNRELTDAEMTQNYNAVSSRVIS